MFKEIKSEFLSIVNNDAMERITHIPSKQVSKSLDLLYNIKFENIERVYSEKLSEDITRLCVIYKEDDKKVVGTDIFPIDGRVNHITLIPTAVLCLDDHNAVSLSKAVITYVAARVNLLQSKYGNIMNLVNDNLLFLIFFQAIPVLTTAIMKEFYSGPSLPKVIYMSLKELIPVYGTRYTENGIETIINILDEGLGVEELLDDGVICSIPVDDKDYPGLWGEVENGSSIEVTVVEPSEDN